MLREIKVEDALGMMLAHDLTQIIPGEFKGRRYKRGHVVKAEDIPVLLSMGKEHIYILELEKGYIHEEDAAFRMATALAGKNTFLTEPHEGKIMIKSAIKGLAKINQAAINELNAIQDVSIATILNNTVVYEGDKLAGTRVTPLIVEEKVVEQVEALASPIVAKITVKPFMPLSIGIVTTGSEVYKGRIEDKFGPVLHAKIESLGGRVAGQRIANDDKDMIANFITSFIDEGVDCVLVTGGMSVDPDDRSPGAIKLTATQLVRYGTPMLPGSMLMIAYANEVPIVGLPGCVIHDEFTSFDVILPRIMAGEKINEEDITTLGYGGLNP